MRSLMHLSPIIKQKSLKGQHRLTRIWTIKGIMEWTTSFFNDIGLEQPRFDTEVLLSFALGVNRLWLYTHFDQPLNSSELATFRKFVIRRSKREPVQYILGKWHFWTSDFIVSPSVLIPRKETEHLIELALKTAKPGYKILDLCTGCGNIAVNIAKELKSSLLYATDISFDAIEIAKRNAVINLVANNICFLVGDLFLPLHRDILFDMILCNPPYVPTGSLKNLQPEISRYEPQIALDGGIDGLAIYRRLIPESLKYLCPSASLIMEIGSDQAEAVSNILYQSGYTDVTIIKDYSGHNRIVLARH